jgi:hypothetical protein
MASQQLGASGTPTGWVMPGSAFGFGSKYTMPAHGGVVTAVSAFFDTWNGSGAHGWLCVWDGNTGALLISVQQGIISNGTETAGGQQWWTQNVTPGKFIAGGASLWIGGYCDQNTLFGTGSGTAGQSSYFGGMPNTGPVAVSSITATGNGPALAYITYTPGGVAHVRRTSWSAGGLVQARRAGAWNANSGFGVRRNGTTWNQGS